MNNLEKILDLQELFYKNEELRINNVRHFLSKYESNNLQKVSILVCRNSAFEPIANQLALILKCFEIDLDFHFGPYDPQLSIGEKKTKYNFTINFWERDEVDISDEDATDLISKQNATLTQITDINIVNILISQMQTFPEQFNNIIPNELSRDLFDDKRADVFGTKVSSKYFLKIAKKIAFEAILPHFTNPIKMLVIDLDGTLHNGVLGEDGESAIEITEDFIKLQKMLLQLRAKGILLTIVSKNNQDDVDSLLKNRYILKSSDCFSVMASWSPKSSKILEVSNMANIDTSAILFLDDNTIELYDVLNNLDRPPSLAYAGFGPKVSLRILTQHPGLFLINPNLELNRQLDIGSNLERELLLEHTISFEEYISALNVELEFHWNADVERAAEMSRKTNQFNFSLKRFSLLAWRRFLESGSNLLQIVYKDKFGSSGIILSVLISRNHQDEVEILELLLSCRALGRGLEDFILREAFAQILSKYDSNTLILLSKDGPRNAPARNWLEKNSTRLSDVKSEETQIWSYTQKQKENK